MPNKWYVNVPAPTEPDAQGRRLPHGPKIPLTAKRSTSTTFSMTTKNASWRVAAVLNGHDAFVKPPAFSGGAEKPEDGDKIFRNELEVSPVGGIQYTITTDKAERGGGKAGNLSKTHVFEAWRKLRYSVNYTNPANLAAFNLAMGDVREVLEKSFIELELCEAKLMKAPPPVRPGMPAIVGEPRTTRLDGDANFDSRAVGEIALRQPHVRLIVVNDICDEVLHVRTVNLVGTAAAGAGFAFDSATGKLVIDTGRSEENIKHAGDIVSLGISTDFPAADIAPGNVSRETEHGITFELPNQHACRISVSGNLHGQSLDKVSFSAAVNKTHDAGHKLRVSTKGYDADFWLADEIIHVDFNGAVLRDVVTPTLDLENRSVGDQTRDSRRKTFGAIGDTKVQIRTQAFMRIGEKLGKGESVDVVVPTTLLNLAQGVTAIDLRLVAHGNSEGNFATVSIVEGTPRKVRVTIPSLLLRAEEPLTEGRFSIQRIELQPTHLQTKRENDGIALRAATKLALGAAGQIKYEIDLAHASLSAALTRLRAGANATVDATWQSLDSFGGYYKRDGSSQTIVVTCIKLTPAQTPDETRRLVKLSILHELGHALRLVQPEETKLDASTLANPLRYTEHGGQGSHCMTGARLNPADQYERDAASPKHLCIMFHTLPPQQLTRPADVDVYCETCTKQLTRLDVQMPPPAE